MHDFLQVLLEWIQAHPQGALWLLFGIAFFDSLFVIGAFVPAAPPLFAIGALVAMGGMELSSAIVIAALGALSGDSISFWLGRHYGERLFNSRMLARHPEALARGQRFFERFGAFSVVLARFLGPLRALTPALAAAAGMRYWLFLLADIIGAFAWAGALILPGVVFGASLGLAAEAAGRLASLLLGLVVLLWLVLWLVMIIARLLQRHASAWVHALLDWSQRHRGIERYSMALLDEDLPETPALTVLAMVLLLAAGPLLYLSAGSGLHSYPSALDAAIFQVMRDLNTPSGVVLAQHLVQIGSWTVYGPLAVLVLLTLLALRMLRAAAHWLAALAFGGMIALGLYAIPLLPQPFDYFDTTDAVAAHGRDLVLAIITYSFLPVLLSTGQNAALRLIHYSASATVILLVLLAQLYLGLQWPSVALLLLGFGLGWTALLGIGYRRHGALALPAGRVLPVVALGFSLALGWQWQHPERNLENQRPVLHALSLSQWQGAAFKRLPPQRLDTSGRLRQTFTLQWAGELEVIAAQLRAAGWQEPAALSPRQALHWLTSSAAIADLPVLPQVHAGHNPALAMRLPVDAEEQYFLRLWPTRYQLDDGRRIWIGSVARQQARSFHRLLRYPVAVELHPPLAPLFNTLPAETQRIPGPLWLLWSLSPREPAAAAPSASP
ncbi:membrane protein DedA, SNARE-associated domain [Solimonas aquatica]|uniref:Membrane protein DedA, SNARE-associated domain n=1 Tax=Solimonas aquatica TaxID=489703 RepID=A0A1H9BSA3_9GAMM|nr:VTT domain-containing protein [Solimonas aquatica]SEP91719.1 membrane protein DedA, SNARE-associated domain [Solimonas aquatica]